MAIPGTVLEHLKQCRWEFNNHREVAPYWRSASSAPLLSHGPMVMNRVG